MAQFQLSPCTLSDVEAMVSVYISAFTHTYLNTALFPPSTVTAQSIRTWLSRRFHRVLVQSRAEIHCFKITEIATGKVAAWVRWGYPFTLSEEEEAKREKEKEQDRVMDEQEQFTRFPVGANEAACADYFGALDLMREKYMRWNQDYICYLLVTDREFGRRGCGSMLLSYVTAIADANGKRIYLEATAAGHPLYSKLGWEDIDLITLDLTKWGGEGIAYNWVMMREPKSKAEI